MRFKTIYFTAIFLFVSTFIAAEEPKRPSFAERGSYVTEIFMRSKFLYPIIGSFIAGNILLNSADAVHRLNLPPAQARQRASLYMGQAIYCFKLSFAFLCGFTNANWPALKKAFSDQDALY